MAHGTRFILIGGFLGAGKTTTIARLAEGYQQRGLRVGVVTNDQAADLVDTHTLRSLGFSVGEVAGACFCCSFNELTDAAEKLGEDQRPDVILAEPVGSCTDLMATVILPLKKLWGDRFDVAPFGVILKRSHGRKILGRQGGGFSPKAEYIFCKQLEEADFVLINRIDEMSPQEADELAALIQSEYPGPSVLRVSARTGRGFDELFQLLEQPGESARRVLELDYDVYAEGEAELGWLNSSMKLTAAEPVDLDGFLMGAVRRLGEALAARDAETAHLKAIGLWEGAYGVANLVSRDSPPELSLPSRCQTMEADVIVNARVAIDPDTLQQEVAAAVQAAAEEAGATVELRQTQSFRPGRPVPTHRFSG